MEVKIAGSEVRELGESVKVALSVVKVVRDDTEGKLTVWLFESVVRPSEEMMVEGAEVGARVNVCPSVVKVVENDGDGRVTV